EGRVDGSVRRPEGEGGEVRERPLRPVLRQDRDRVTPRDSQVTQTHRELLHRGAELVGADGPPGPLSLVLEVLRLPVGVDGVIEDVADGPDRHHLPPRPGAAPARPGRTRATLPGAPAPCRKRSTTGVASWPRSYPLPPMIQDVTISSRAPKKTLVATLRFRSSRGLPLPCPSSMTSFSRAK